MNRFCEVILMYGSRRFLSPQVYWPIVLLLSSHLVLAQEGGLRADFAVRVGKIRPLHGVNKGPLAPGGLIDLAKEQKELQIPFTRLHDCGWPNPYVIDHHAVFPNPDADPALPESYDFRLTDEYIEAVLKTGAAPIYRLGESIEHTTIKRYAHPPTDMKKWADVCRGIIRHYNEGWAKGFHHQIRYWEIWNEPENRPAMWSGTDEDYLLLYRTAVLGIKKEFPALKVGGPALGASGSFVDGKFVPTDFVKKFLSMCRTENVPLNFFSWHCYTSDPSELTARAHAIRRILDAEGFTETESHLNEWNYLPGSTWEPISKSATPVARQRFYEAMAGAKGAAFIAASLLELQDAPVDVCNLFHGEVGGFGLFNEQGVPLKSYQALRAFQGLAKMEGRVQADGAVTGKLGFAASLSADGREAAMLVSNFADSRSEIELNWSGFSFTGGVTAEIHIIADSSDLSSARTEFIPGASGSLKLKLKAPALALILLKPTEGKKAETPLSITSPANRLVFQRDLSGKATIRVGGKCAWPGRTIEARVVDVTTSQPGTWTNLGTVQADLSYRGALVVPAGWYSLEVRAVGLGDLAQASVERVGVGEVFVVVGHSVAHGAQINLPGAKDDRVSTIALAAGDMESQRSYRISGDPQFLPAAVGSQFDDNVQPAPVGRGTYFWAAFAEQVAKEQNVPVLVMNAAFGGTSLEHWAKSSRGEKFDHPFVNSSIRMPYIQLLHALSKYGAITGLRAILADQGQNDWPEKDEERILANYQAWIDQIRKEMEFTELAVVINRQTPPPNAEHIRRVQDRMIKEHPHCFAGPDYDTLSQNDTTDGIHLSEVGAQKAATLWARALDVDFFKSAQPLLPR